LKGKRVLLLAFILIMINLSFSRGSLQPVNVEFLYYEPCSTCPGAQKYYQVYLHNRGVIQNIQRDYGENVNVSWIYFFSPEGLGKVDEYNLTLADWNTIIVNHEVVFLGGDKFVNETHLREVIDFLISPPQVLVHDISVDYVAPSVHKISIGEVLDVNVTISNRGNYTESFNMAVHLNDSVVGQLFVEDLEAQEQRVLVFSLETSNYSVGNYTLCVSVNPVPNETKVDNNHFIYGVIELTTPANTSKVEHDIAISISVLKNRLEINETFLFSLNLTNKGGAPENVSLKIYINQSLTMDKLVHLNIDETQTIQIKINTTGLVPGVYQLRSVIEPVENELILSNNECHLLFEILSPTRFSSQSDNSAEPTFMAMLLLAFILGFFETFSPCVLVLLSFILGYTISGEVTFKDSFLKVFFFGVGFISAAALLGIAFAVILLSSPAIQHVLTWIVCVFAIVFGLNLTGLLRFPLETKPMIQKLAKKYVFTLFGIFTLGFIFYFLDPCVAPIFASMVPLLSQDMFYFLLFVFVIGAIIPFIGIGFFVGSISKLTRSAYRHRALIRGISGVILMCYALYLILFYLI